jgi:hypothetical protein
MQRAARAKHTSSVLAKALARSGETLKNAVRRFGGRAA